MTNAEKEIAAKLGKRSLPKGKKGRSTPLPKHIQVQKKRNDDEILRMSDHPYRKREGTRSYPVDNPRQFCLADIVVADHLKDRMPLDEYIKTPEYLKQVEESRKLAKKTTVAIPLARKNFDYWTSKLGGNRK